VFTAPVDPAVVREVASVYGVQPFPPSGRLVTNDVIDALRGDDAY
jgi:hypothetical protein